MTQYKIHDIKYTTLVLWVRNSLRQATHLSFCPPGWSNCHATCRRCWWNSM